MSWLRSAVNKAVEVGNKNNLTRTVRSYADSVVQHAGQAVAEGAKLLQDRIVARNFRSAKLAIKRLEEAAVACRGPERTQLLRKWVIVLQEIEKLSGGSSESKTPEHYLTSGISNDNTRRPPLVMYSDSDVGGEPMNFRDVFLQSQALEGITLSMILEAPTEEEISLLLEMFGLCLTGGKEIHNAIVSSIQDLAQAFASYKDEVLVKHEELLQFAQIAITGLKINAYLGRIDAEASSLKKKLDDIAASKEHSGESSNKDSIETIESLKKALARIRICSKLHGLLLKKKLITTGDSPEIHAQKVGKLKILLESLSSSTEKAEKRILENRCQKEEALNVRVAKASEVNEKEKELADEISGLEKQRDELEAELKKVNISLAAANARLRNTMEERDQFEEANNHIIAHLKTKEDEMSKSIALCRIEAGVLNTWINFMEDTWVLQCSYSEIKEKQFNDELEKHEDYFVNLAIDLLSAYKRELDPAISRIGKYVENLKNLSDGPDMEARVDSEDPKLLNPRRNLEEEYLDYESKIITTFSVVDNMKEQLYGQEGKIPSKDDPRVKELFDDVGKLREQFESIERPILEIETPTPKAEAQSSDNAEEIPIQRAEPQSLEKLRSPFDPPVQVSMTEKEKIKERSASDKTSPEDVLNPEAELAMLESEFGNIGQDYSAQEINDWEFDELERELREGDSETTK